MGVVGVCCGLLLVRGADCTGQVVDRGIVTCLLGVGEGREPGATAAFHGLEKIIINRAVSLSI